MARDVVDYEIKGAEMQFVEIEPDPAEAAVGEAGKRLVAGGGHLGGVLGGGGE